MSWAGGFGGGYGPGIGDSGISGGTGRVGTGGVNGFGGGYGPGIGGASSSGGGYAGGGPTGGSGADYGGASSATGGVGGGFAGNPSGYGGGGLGDMGGGFGGQFAGGFSGFGGYGGMTPSDISGGVNPAANGFLGVPGMTFGNTWNGYASRPGVQAVVGGAPLPSNNFGPRSGFASMQPGMMESDGYATHARPSVAARAGSTHTKDKSQQRAPVSRNPAFLGRAPRAEPQRVSAARPDRLVGTSPHPPSSNPRPGSTPSSRPSSSPSTPSSSFSAKDVEAIADMVFKGLDQASGYFSGIGGRMQRAGPDRSRSDMDRGKPDQQAIANLLRSERGFGGGGR